MHSREIHTSVLPVRWLRRSLEVGFPVRLLSSAEEQCRSQTSSYWWHLRPKVHNTSLKGWNLLHEASGSSYLLQNVPGERCWSAGGNHFLPFPYNAGHSFPGYLPVLLLQVRLKQHPLLLQSQTDMAVKLH